VLLMTGWLIVLTLGLGYANGANDVSKGIATLVGSGVTDYRRAVLWGSVWTIAGGVLAGLVASGMMATFSGQVLLVSAPTGESFPVAVACGAIGWLVVATLAGLPVSTTPCAARRTLWRGDRRPRHFRRSLGSGGMEGGSSSGRIALSLAGASRVLTVIAGADCPPQVVSRVNLLDSLHWLSSGLTGLFRGLNDTPKILALGIAAAAATGLSRPSLYVLIALSMGAGSYLAGARVTGTLAAKVTRMTPGEGFAAKRSDRRILPAALEPFPGKIPRVRSG
jgi:PiT family inorganic phosphate transporter